MATPAWMADRLQRMPRRALLLPSVLLVGSAAPGSGRRTPCVVPEEETKVWFDLDLSGAVELAGGPEPKTRWVHHERDAIKSAGVE